jgi:hypothetical protein
MIMLRCLGCLFACALSACALNGAAPKAGADGRDLPPRLATSANEPPGVTGIYSQCGFTVVGNADELHFRMELAGGKVGVRHGNAKDMYGVDGLTVQLTTVPAEDLGPSARGLDGVELLRLHAAWESAHLSKTLGREGPPEELEILTSDNMPAALVWWFPGNHVEVSAPATEGGDVAAPASDDRPVEDNRPTGLVFMTAAFGHRILVMSVQGLQSEPRATMVTKAKAWMATVTRSPRAISAKQVSEDIRTAMAAGQTCPGRANAVLEQYPDVVEASADADRSLRFDGLSGPEAAQAKTVAQAQGGVARRRIPTGLRYTNYICRFEFVLPPGWQENAAQDFNGHGCSLDLTTAEVKSEESKPISNALAVVATKATPELGREALHQRLLATIKNGGGHTDRVTPALIEGALEEHFLSERDGHKYEGDLITLQRGDFLYQFFFTATPATYPAGHTDLVQFLTSARWNIEEAR